jgi:choline dehydrogenase-like flavoprotein
VVNRYGQSWDIPNLFVLGSSTHPTMSGFNPTLTIQALAFMSADAIVNRYKKSPGRLSSRPGSHRDFVAERPHTAITTVVGVHQHGH